MAYDERARLALLQRLEQLLGEETARTMMEHLPPTGWDDLATKSDLEQLRVATRSDLEQLRVATKGDLDHLRTDVESLRSSTNYGFELLRTEMAKGFAELRADFRGEINAAITSQTRSMIFAVLGAVVVMTGLVLGLARPV